MNEKEITKHVHAFYDFIKKIPNIVISLGNIATHFSMSITIDYAKQIY